MVAAVVPMTLWASRGYRDVLLAAIALVQCYATRTQNGCAPLSYHATMAECRVLAEDYQRFDCRRWSATAVLRLTNDRRSGEPGSGKNRARPAREGSLGRPMPRQTAFGVACRARMKM